MRPGCTVFRHGNRPDQHKDVYREYIPNRRVAPKIL